MHYEPQENTHRQQPRKNFSPTLQTRWGGFSHYMSAFSLAGFRMRIHVVNIENETFKSSSNIGQLKVCAMYATTDSPVTQN